MSSLKRLCQAVLAMNDQVNLQTTLKKGAGGASLTNFVTDCRCKNTFFGVALIKCFGMLSRWVNTKKWNKTCFRGRLITRSTFCDTKIFFKFFMPNDNEILFFHLFIFDTWLSFCCYVTIKIYDNDIIF